MNVLEKILEEIKEVEKKFVVGHEVLFALGATGIATEIEEIIRSHMDDEDNDGWIPVEERLPDRENKESYDINLVTLEDGEVCIGVYRDDKKEWWTRKKEGETLYTTKHNVIAWKPLPEPYKPNKDNSATEHIISRFMKVE